MKSSMPVYIVSALLAVVAAIAIAGLPDSGSDGGGDIAVPPSPSTTSTTSTTSTSIPPSSTTAVLSPTSSRGTTTVAVPPSTSAAPDLTAPRPSSTTTTQSIPVVPRAELDVATANASNRSGVAAAAAEALERDGYVDVSPVDAVSPAATSAIFHVEGREVEALRLRDDLGWSGARIARMTEAPPLQTSRTFDLVVVIGGDRAVEVVP